MTDNIGDDIKLRKEIALNSGLNGIDYVEVRSFENKEKTGYDSLIAVYCIKEVDEPIDKTNITITGGSRIRNIDVHWAKIADDLDEDTIPDDLLLPDKKKVILIHTERGDFSNYTLYLRGSTQTETLSNFDSRISHIDFIFPSECSADFDCKHDEYCPPKIFPTYEIDYMAKDYASFRQNMFDRLAQISPKWKEQSPADIGITLVELLAYVGDNLSYYQDAVANEAYLGTARKRISVKRHSRLLDYSLKEGHNARTLVCFDVDNSGDNAILAKGTKLLTRVGETTSDQTTIPVSKFDAESTKNEIIFETMYEIVLRKSLNHIIFHTWSDSQSCIPQGSTHATLQNKNNILYDNMLFAWNPGFTHDEFGYLSPFDISENEENAILDFFNSVDSETDIVNAIELPEEIDVGYKIAKRIIETRKKIGYFERISEIYDIPFIGPERFTEIVISLRGRLSNEEKNRLFSFLKRYLGLSWIDNAYLLRDDSKKNIVISDLNHKNNIVISFDEQNNIATLEYDKKSLYQFHLRQNAQNGYDVFALSVLPGDILIFEEIRSPTTCREEDSDKTHKQAIRIITALPQMDKVENTPIVEISWDVDDALSFPLCISNCKDNKGSSFPTSVAYGNVVLADHGCTIAQPPIKDKDIEDHPYYVLDKKGIVASQSLGYPIKDKIFYPYLFDGPLTFAGPAFDASVVGSTNKFSTVSSLFNFDKDDVLPSVEVFGDGVFWKPKKDLLSSGKFDTNFVVEVDDDGIAYFRFGDDEHGRKPTYLDFDEIQKKNLHFYTKFRVGNGQEGNVGSDALGMIVSDVNGITRIRNPIPASGGTDAEPIARAQQMAPNALQEQKRTVTENDYVEILEKRPDIQKAKAVLRWTGSWYTVFVMIDRTGGLEIDDNFKQDVIDYLEKYRLTVYDIAVLAPTSLAVDIKLRIHVMSDHRRESVKEKLLEVFGIHDLNSKKTGFFHPDNFTFGQPLYVSQLYQTALDVDGVSSVEIIRFQRWKKEYRHEIEDGFIRPGASEIIQAYSNPNFPENGKIDFDMCGGL